MKIFAATVLMLACAGLACAQKPPSDDAPAKAKLVWEWNDAARKINAMAADFPEDKYDYKPTEKVRTFAQVMLHLAFWNQWVEQTAKGGKPDGKLNELPRSEYKTKAQVVEVVKKSFADAAKALDSMSDEAAVKHVRLFVGFIEHTGEHYGQLVMYYRLNDLVPPESR